MCTVFSHPIPCSLLHFLLRISVAQQQAQWLIVLWLMMISLFLNNGFLLPVETLTWGCYH